MFMDPWPSYVTILEKKRAKEHYEFDVQGSESIGHVWIRNRYSESFA